ASRRRAAPSPGAAPTPGGQVTVIVILAETKPFFVAVAWCWPFAVPFGTLTDAAPCEFVVTVWPRKLTFAPATASPESVTLNVIVAACWCDTFLGDAAIRS